MSRKGDFPDRWTFLRADQREALSEIWTKFYKVDKARTREYGGSGVGLSIVKAMMEAMNQAYGVINYSNGVEFWFELETSERLE